MGFPRPSDQGWILSFTLLLVMEGEGEHQITQFSKPVKASGRKTSTLIPRQRNSEENLPTSAFYLGISPRRGSESVPRHDI